MISQVLAACMVLSGTGTAALGEGHVCINNVHGAGADDSSLVLRYDGQALPKEAGRIEVLDASGTVIGSSGGGGVEFVRDGIFDLGDLAISGTVPGGDTTIVLRLWNATTGETYAQALERTSVEVPLSGLGDGAGGCRNLLEISERKALPRIPAGVRDLRVTQLVGSTLLSVHAVGRPNASYRLDVSTNLTQWTPILLMTAGPGGTPPLPDWVPFETVTPNTGRDVRFFRLISGDDEP